MKKAIETVEKQKGHEAMSFTKRGVANRVKRNNKRKNRGKGSKYVN